VRVWAALIVAGVLLAGAAPECSAQLFGSKKAKVSPQQRVPELVGILKLDKDAHKRSEAAEELRQYDPKEFPEVVPILIDALQNDTATGVRVEAAAGLGRLRPISTAAGQALERAAANDSNLRVRLQAKASLVYYQMSGYHAPKKSEPVGPAVNDVTDEPPLAAGISDQWWKNNPPQAKSPPPTVMPTTDIYRPLPSAPKAGKDVPVVTAPATVPPLQPAPTWVPVDPAQTTGPRLDPPE